MSGFITSNRGLHTIKTDSVFSVIREINEILSLTNEPEKLVNTALDTFSQLLNIECCWAQTISGAQNQLLSLTAERGFSDAMRSEIAAINMRHDFSRQIVGMGNKIVIPDLNNDGLYGLASFRTAGYKWLVAVPLMTYRVYGILGAASQNRKLLEKETADLIMVIAGLIANALSKAQLTQRFKPRVEAKDIINEEPRKEMTSEAKPEIKTEIVPAATVTETIAEKPPATPPADTTLKKNPPKRVDPVFHSHKHKMENFRKSHR